MQPLCISPNHGLVVILRVEAVADDANGTHPLCRLVAQMHAMKILERCLRGFGDLDGDHGQNLLEKTVPNAHRTPLRMLHFVGML
jgi:hypothetical protein